MSPSWASETSNPLSKCTAYGQNVSEALTFGCSSCWYGGALHSDHIRRLVAANVKNKKTKYYQFARFGGLEFDMHLLSLFNKRFLTSKLAVVNVQCVWLNRLHCIGRRMRENVISAFVARIHFTTHATFVLECSTHFMFHPAFDVLNRYRPHHCQLTRLKLRFVTRIGVAHSNFRFLSFILFSLPFFIYVAVQFYHFDFVVEQKKKTNNK